MPKRHGEADGSLFGSIRATAPCAVEADGSLFELDRGLPARLMAVYSAVYGLLHRVRILHRVLFGLFDRIAQTFYLKVYGLFGSIRSI
jgi:hypothetical protein